MGRRRTMQWSWSMWRSWHRVLDLSLDEVRNEVLALVAAGRVFEVAPRQQDLGPAAAWLGPANRDFCRRFEQLTVRGCPAELVLGAQALADGGRVGLLAGQGQATQVAGQDGVELSGFVGPRDCFASLWHLALCAAEVLPAARMVGVVNAPVERVGVGAAHPGGCAGGCAAAPLACMLAAWLGRHDYQAAFDWLLAALVAGAVGWQIGVGANVASATAHRARRRVLPWSPEQARDYVLATIESRAQAELTPALCPLDCELPLPAGVRELFATHCILSERDGRWRLDRGELRRSDLLHDHVRVGWLGESKEIAASPSGEEIVVAAGSRSAATIVERWPSIWHLLAGRLLEATDEQDWRPARPRLTELDTDPSVLGVMRDP